MFFSIYEATRRLWLTSVDDLERRKEHLLVLCFAFIPTLFGDEIEDALKHTVPPIAGDSSMLSAAGWSLWKNGVPAERLVSMLHAAGADIVAALSDAHQWGTLSQGSEPAGKLGQQNVDFPSERTSRATAMSIFSALLK